MQQELSSAKYFMPEATLPPPPLPTGAPLPSDVPAAPKQQRSRLEQAHRYVAAFMGVAVLACAGGVLWLQRADIQDGAKRVRTRTSNPFDIVHWLGGSEKTFGETLADIPHNPKYNLGEFGDGSAFESEFSSIDWSSYSPTWSENGSIIPLSNDQSFGE